MRHLAPTIVIEIHRYTEPDRFGFHTLTPNPDWNVHPLGTEQPSYERSSLLLGEETAEGRRADLHGQGFLRYLWDEIPQYLQEFVIDSEAPLEWKSGLRDGKPGLTGAVTVWVLGQLPTAFLTDGMTTLEARLKKYEAADS